MRNPAPFTPAYFVDTISRADFVARLGDDYSDMLPCASYTESDGATVTLDNYRDAIELSNRGIPVTLYYRDDTIPPDYIGTIDIYARVYAFCEYIRRDTAFAVLDNPESLPPAAFLAYEPVYEADEIVSVTAYGAAADEPHPVFFFTDHRTPADYIGVFAFPTIRHAPHRRGGYNPLYSILLCEHIDTKQLDTPFSAALSEILHPAPDVFFSQHAPFTQHPDAPREYISAEAFGSNGERINGERIEIYNLISEAISDATAFDLFRAFVAGLSRDIFSRTDYFHLLVYRADQAPTIYVFKPVRSV